MRDAIETIGMILLAVGAFIAACGAIVLYLLAIGAGIGAVVGGAVWAFRWLTGI